MAPSVASAALAMNPASYGHAGHAGHAGGLRAPRRARVEVRRGSANGSQALALSFLSTLALRGGASPRGRARGIRGQRAGLRARGGSDDGLRPWQRQLPNVLTCLRILAIVPVMALFYLPWKHSPLACCCIFAAASATDGIDGYLARRWKVVSPFGQFLDPVADKLLACAVLVLLPTAEFESRASLAVPAALIILREIFASALREWTAKVGESSLTQVGVWGKLKTAVILLSLCGLLATCRSGFSSGIFKVSLCLLYLGTVLAYISIGSYLKAAMPAFKAPKKLQELASDESK